MSLLLLSYLIVYSTLPLSFLSPSLSYLPTLPTPLPVTYTSDTAILNYFPSPFIPSNHITTDRSTVDC